MILIQQCMLNLCQLTGFGGAHITDLEVHRFSRFSISFRILSNLSSNTGKHIDHSQSEELHDSDHSEANFRSSNVHASAAEHSCLPECTKSEPEHCDRDRITIAKVCCSVLKHELGLEGGNEVSTSVIPQSFSAGD